MSITALFILAQSLTLFKEPQWGWGYNSVEEYFAQHAQSPVFNPQNHPRQKKKKRKKENRAQPQSFSSQSLPFAILKILKTILKDFLRFPLNVHSFEATVILVFRLYLLVKFYYITCSHVYLLSLAVYILNAFQANFIFLTPSSNLSFFFPLLFQLSFLLQDTDLSFTTSFLV